MSSTCCSHYFLWQENLLTQFVFNMLNVLCVGGWVNLIYIWLQGRMLTAFTFPLLKTVFLLTENTTHPFSHIHFSGLQQHSGRCENTVSWKNGFNKEEMGLGVILSVLLKLHWSCLALDALLELLYHQILTHLSYRKYILEWDPR